MAWPSGKAEACKASIPSSNLGATFTFSYIIALMLFIVATPIGNLSDITYRAIETLKSCEYILCEDTRHSLALLQHYDIHKPLKSYHKFNEKARQKELIKDLLDGRNIALISDAGTPGISDPGAPLIAACISQNIKVVAIPGACAAITALCCSGLETGRFQFWGFLPKKQGELKRTLHELLAYPGTSICYESPNRLLDVLEVLNAIAPDRHLVVTRELTKKFEEIRRDTPANLIQHWKHSSLKGEIVLLISGETKETVGDWTELTLQQHVEMIQTLYGLTKREAIQTVAKIRGTSKRDVYNSVNK